MLERVLGLLLAREHVPAEGDQAAVMAVVDRPRTRDVTLPDERGQRLVGLVRSMPAGVASGNVDRYYVNCHGASLPKRPLLGNPSGADLVPWSMHRLGAKVLGRGARPRT